jgi:uncharacterized protein (TIGR02391 family)
MLTGDAKQYVETFVRRRRDELLKQRDTDRAQVKRGLTDFQLDCDYMVGLARAHFEAVRKAYELEGQTLTQQIVDYEIMPQVAKILTESSAGVISSAKSRMELLRRRTNRVDAGVSAKLGSLTRQFDKLVHETKEAIRNEATLHIHEAKKLEAKKNSVTQKRSAVLPPGEYKYHPEIQKVSLQLFLEGNFRQAVLDAFIHLIATVKQRTGLSHDGDDLMNRAFSPKDRVPPVCFNALSTQEERDQQAGIWFLFKGVVQMRNYKAHVVTSSDDPQRAHEYLALASLLMRLLDIAKIEKPEQGAA